jgi:hypothetical protein
MERIDTLLHQALSDVPVAPGGLEQTMGRVQSRRQWRARRRAAGLGAVVAILAAAGINGLSRNTPSASATTVRLPGRIVDVADTAGRMWALTCTQRCASAQHSSGRLVAIDVRTGRTGTSIGVRSPQVVAAEGDSVWTADFWDSTVTRVSTTTGRALTTIRLTLPKPIAGDDARFLPSDLTIAQGAVWVSTARGYVARIDQQTNDVTAMIKTPDDATGPLASASGSIWIGEGLALGRLDPTNESLSQMHIDGPDGRRLSIGGLAFAGGELWVSGIWASPSRDATGHSDYTATDEAVLVAVDPATGAVGSTTALPTETTLQNSDAHRLWLASTRTSEIYEFSPKSRRIVAAARVRASGPIVPARGRRVWVARSGHEFTLVELRKRAAR